MIIKNTIKHAEPKKGDKFEVLFESNKILRFDNSNEQGESYKASVERNKPSSKWFAMDGESDVDDNFEHVSSKKTKKKGHFNPNYSKIKPQNDRQNVTLNHRP